jgi:microcystin-dependent protein
MADKKFGVKQLDLIGTGTPTITSANNLNINATTTAIQNDVTIGGKIGLGGANYGSSGQVLTSNGTSSDPTWQTSSGGFVTGMIMMFSGTTAPTGWVLCDNSTAAQGANAPDLRDRFVVGTGNSYNLNATGGSANAVLVSHSHTVDHYPDDDGSGNPTRITAARQVEAEMSPTASMNTNSQGVSGTNANLPPYYALAFIMKT